MASEKVANCKILLKNTGGCDTLYKRPIKVICKPSVKTKTPTNKGKGGANPANKSKDDTSYTIKQLTKVISSLISIIKLTIRKRVISKYTLQEQKPKYKGKLVKFTIKFN
jgi:hypothetical protein